MLVFLLIIFLIVFAIIIAINKPNQTAEEQSAKALEELKNYLKKR